MNAIVSHVVADSRRTWSFDAGLPRPHGECQVGSCDASLKKCESSG